MKPEADICNIQFVKMIAVSTITDIDADPNEPVLGREDLPWENDLTELPGLGLPF
jgi:hypothetical protein